jgi:hypothetical protein
MAIFKQNSEGNTSGDVVTTTTSGLAGNTTFTYANPGLTYSSSQASHGTLSVSVPTSVDYNGAGWTVTADRTFAGRLYFYATGAASTDFILFQLQVNGALSVRVLFQGAGKMRLTTKGSIQQWTATNTYPLNQWVRVEFEGNIGTTASNGQVRMLYYLGDSTTPVDQSPWVTGLDLGGGTGTIDHLYIYKYGSGTASGSLWEDDIEIRTGSSYSGLIGPVASTGPTADAGGYTVVPPATAFTLDGTGSTGSGSSIVSWSWTALWPSSGAPTLSGSSTSTATGTSNVEGSVYVYQLTVTDGNGASDTDTANVLVTSSGGGAGGIDLIWDGSAWL